MHDLDFGAFKEHLERPYFRDFLNRTVKQLACRLSRILGMLFSGSPDTIGHDYSFHAWNEASDSSNERRYHYEKLFRNALELKSDSVITDDTYTFEFSLNQNYTHNAVDELGFQEGTWLRLSICSYKSKASASQSEKESALVRTKNFSSAFMGQSLCNYQRRVYLGVGQTYEPQNMFQSIDDPINASLRFGTGNRNREKDICHFQNPSSITKTGSKDHFVVAKVPTQENEIFKSPDRPSSSKRVVCKICKMEFRTRMGFRTHERNGMLQES